MRLGFQGTVHDIQEINFNPRSRPGDEDYGLLYIAAGDGGAGWRSSVPQDLYVPQGKILRIDPDGDDGPGGRYGIPATNPFVHRQYVLGEIYAYGLRDPHRFSWDAGTGRMFVGNIGEHRVESVYEVRSGTISAGATGRGPSSTARRATRPAASTHSPTTTGSTATRIRSPPSTTSRRRTRPAPTAATR